MKIIILALALSIINSSCNTTSCNCQMGNVDIVAIDSLNEILTSLYDDYWEVVYDEENIENSSDDIIRLETSFFLAPYSKIYTIKKVNDSIKMTTKVALSDLNTKNRSYTIISTKEIDLNTNDWEEMLSSVNETCFWSELSMTSMKPLDGMPFTLSINFQKANPCTDRKYHIVSSLYSRTKNNPTNQIFELITKYDSTIDVVTLNEESQQKKDN